MAGSHGEERVTAAKAGSAPVIDFHTHLTPLRYRASVSATGTWHGLGPEAGEMEWPGFCRNPDERLEDMRRMRVEVQVVSPTAGFYLYDRDVDTALTVAREANDEIAAMAGADPGRFVGLATVPMQDVAVAIDEMHRAVGELGLRGVMIGDHVNGRTYDEPRFRPFWKAAEELGAIVFLHQGADNITTHRIDRYGLGNSVGNLVERTLAFAALVYGGVPDRYPRLKLLLAHAGGYAPFGAARMDKATRVALPEVSGGAADWPELNRMPSDYLSFFYYDACTFSAATLRFLLDTVGARQVVLGTDYPAPMILHDAVEWISSLDVLTEQEKTAILSTNAAALLSL